jgi:hypothetical protein
MPLKRHVVKSCCGSSNIIIETEKPIRKPQSKVFREAGYFLPENFFQAGIFYVQLKQLIATASYGTNKINIRCSGADCESQLAEFESLLERAISL